MAGGNRHKITVVEQGDGFHGIMGAWAPVEGMRRRREPAVRPGDVVGEMRDEATNAVRKEHSVFVRKPNWTV